MPRLLSFTSTVTNGSMKPLTPDDESENRQRRLTFLTAHDISPDTTTCVRLEYQGDDFCRYTTIDDSHKGDGITRPSSLIADALVVLRPNHALFLPLADCVGAIIYDPTRQILMVSHLGRHNLEQQGASRSIEYLVSMHSVDPKNVEVWLSPAAGPKAYPLHELENRGLQDEAIEQLIATGVIRENIAASPIDVTEDTRYYSHSEFLKGNRPDDGRFAIVAMMKDDEYATPV